MIGYLIACANIASMILIWTLGSDNSKTLTVAPHNQNASNDKQTTGVTKMRDQSFKFRLAQSQRAKQANISRFLEPGFNGLRQGTQTATTAKPQGFFKGVFSFLMSLWVKIKEAIKYV